MREREVIVAAVDRMQERFNDAWRVADSRKVLLATAERRASGAEAKLATARVEGAREALTKLARVWPRNVTGTAFGPGYASTTLYDASVVTAFRDQHYPAPSSGEGTHKDCDVGTDPWSREAYHRCRPTPQAAPEPLVVPVEWYDTPENPQWVAAQICRITVTPDIARRLWSLANSTTEGK